MRSSIVDVLLAVEETVRNMTVEEHIDVEHDQIVVQTEDGPQVVAPFPLAEWHEQVAGAHNGGHESDDMLLSQLEQARLGHPLSLLCFLVRAATPVRVVES
ncbi:MAG: hypothetical protein CMF11_02215 [Idiomarina sp.]|nr:hypothetical protein [Idiomarina sp.]